LTGSAVIFGFVSESTLAHAHAEPANIAANKKSAFIPL
jgi:hypothetical protein